MNNGFEVVKEQILSIIEPTQEEVVHQQHIIQQIISKLREQSNKIGESFSFIEAQGSTGAKQTQLRGSADIDIFVAQNPDRYSIFDIPKKERKSTIDTIFDNQVDDWFVPVAKLSDAENIQKTYTQHPYLSMEIDGIDIDVVGCFDISQDILESQGPITAVDRTIHHSRYVSERLNHTKRNDVRILKSFIHACHTYGDIPAIGWMGFPGYAIELIVLESVNLSAAFQTLINLSHTPVDTLTRRRDELSSLTKFQGDDIFIMDPTDSNRNVASSIDKRAYRWTRIRAQEVLRLMKESDFKKTVNLLIRQEIPVDEIPGRYKQHTFSFEFRESSAKHYTVIRDKIQSVARRIRFELQKENTGEERFGRVLSELIYENKVFALGFLVQKGKISDTYNQRGPPSHMREAIEKFKEAHKYIVEVDGYYWAERKRDWNNAKLMTEYLINEYSIPGLENSDSTEVSSKVLNVLTQYVTQVETDFELSE